MKVTISDDMKFVYTTILVLLVAACMGQKKRPQKVLWFDWYDSAAFFQGPRPITEGYGPLSDSLSKSNNGVTIFEFNRQYYKINCLADYYFWFTQKYDYLFRKSPKIYERIYYAGDSFGLAQFVKKNYKGRRLPVKFRFPYDPTIPIDAPPAKDPERPVTIPNPRYLNDH